jgi:hypothetical protein
MSSDFQTNGSLENHSLSHLTPIYKVSFYRPTCDFNQTPEFMAIMSQSDELIAVMGPAFSGDTALMNAKLFSYAPLLHQQLQLIYDTLTQTSPTLSSNQTFKEAEQTKAFVSHWLKNTESILSALENCLV